jgi:hypothetical protein
MRRIRRVNSQAVNIQAKIAMGAATAHFAAKVHYSNLAIACPSSIPNRGNMLSDPANRGASVQSIAHVPEASATGDRFSSHASPGIIPGVLGTHCFFSLLSTPRLLFVKTVERKETPVLRKIFPTNSIHLTRDDQTRHSRQSDVYGPTLRAA